MPEQAKPTRWALKTLPGPEFVIHADGFGHIASLNASGPNSERNAQQRVHAELFAAAPETAAALDRLKVVNEELLEALKIIAEWPVRADGLPANDFDSFRDGYDAGIKSVAVHAQTAIDKAHDQCPKCAKALEGG